jgi:hypothetical protein
MDSIVEIGSWKGKTTHVLCSGCRGMVTAVDHFQGNEGEKETYHKDWKNSYNEFMQNVGNRFSNLDIIADNSLAASKRILDRYHKVDMVFIDGGHQLEEDTEDLKAWNPLVTKLICGHDYTNMTGVQKAVNDFFGSKSIHTYESIWYIQK